MRSSISKKASVTSTKLERAQRYQNRMHWSVFNRKKIYRGKNTWIYPNTRDCFCVIRKYNAKIFLNLLISSKATLSICKSILLQILIRWNHFRKSNHRKISHSWAHRPLTRRFQKMLETHQIDRIRPISDAIDERSAPFFSTCYIEKRLQVSSELREHIGKTLADRIYKIPDKNLPEKSETIDVTGNELVDTNEYRVIGQNFLYPDDLAHLTSLLNDEDQSPSHIGGPIVNAALYWAAKNQRSTGPRKNVEMEL